MDLESRLRELEQELGQLRNRWQTSRRSLIGAVLAGVLLTLGGVWLVGVPVQAQQGNRMAVQGTSFVLVDDTGVKQMDITSSKSGALLTFYHKDKGRLILGTKDGEPGMLFLNSNGKLAMDMFTSPKVTRLSIRDSEEKQRVILSHTPAKSAVRIQDGKGQEVWTTP